MYVNIGLFLVTTILTLFNSLSHVILNYALHFFIKESTSARDILQEIKNVNAEMSQVSMMEEFARHARLQRKLIKLREELKTEKISLNTSRLQYKVYASTATSAISGFFTLVLMYMYRAEPVVVLPENWLSPFSSVISWPSKEAGAVSTLFWFVACGFVFRSISTKLS